MATVTLPEGRYLFGVRAVRTTYGGRTNAMLTRARLFAAAGTASSILTFDAYGDYAGEVTELRRDGRLVEAVEILNIYDYQRGRDWADERETGDKLPLLESYTAKPEYYSDGTPWRITYIGPKTIHDYQRPDGSVYLRTPTDLVNRADKGANAVVRVGRCGNVLGTFRDAAEWFQSWVGSLADPAPLPTFLMLEDFFLSHLMTPMDDDRIHEILFVHVPHTNSPRRWDSTLNKKAAVAFGKLADVDAAVLLTDRQREDVDARYGRRNHVFTIPNLIEVPDLPSDPAPRESDRFLAIARLDPGKRLDQTIDAFARVHKARPTARLDIAGDGPERERLQQHIDKLGLARVVTLLGHDPQARERLWSVGALVITTAYEAFPLVILEAMSRACPVVSYDVKYGPREMVGENGAGTVVADGDVAAIADAMLRLAGDAELIGRMGSAGRAAASEAYSPERVLALWSDMLQQIVTLKPGRVGVDKFGLRVREVGFAEGATDGVGDAPAVAEECLRVDVDLTAGLTGPTGFAEDLVIAVEVVVAGTGERIVVPCHFESTAPGSYRVRSDVPLRSLADQRAGVNEYRVRVSFTCRNAGWANYVTRPHKTSPVEELFHDKYGRLTLRSGYDA